MLLEVVVLHKEPEALPETIVNGGVEAWGLSVAGDPVISLFMFLIRALSESWLVDKLLDKGQ